MQNGEVVWAAGRIEEPNFGGKDVHVHAEPGDEGRIVDIASNGLIMVRWLKTGTACDCDPVEDLTLTDPLDQERPAPLARASRG